MDPIAIYEWVNRVGLFGGMALFIWSLYTDKLVWGKDVKKMETAHEKEMVKAELALKIAQDAYQALITASLSKLDRLEKWAEERSAK